MENLHNLTGGCYSFETGCAIIVVLKKKGVLEEVKG